MGFLDTLRKREERAAREAGPAKPVATAPQAPAMVKQVSVRELKDKLDRGDKPLIVDVREEWEFNVVHLEAAVLIPMSQIRGRLGELDKNAEIVVQCHHGNRSQVVAQFLVQNGFRNVSNLEGGIDAWAREIDPQMRFY